MKTKMKTLLSLSLVCLYSLALAGCGKEETTTVEVPSTPPAVEEEHDHAHHDHEHGPHGFPVVEMSDGVKVEFGFDDDFGMFAVMPPETDNVETVGIKTVTAGEEKFYEFEAEEAPEGISWVFESKELGTAMMMGDAVERTLVITMKDGTAATAAVEPMGH